MRRGSRERTRERELLVSPCRSAPSPVQVISHLSIAPQSNLYHCHVHLTDDAWSSNVSTIISAAAGGEGYSPDWHWGWDRGGMTVFSSLMQLGKFSTRHLLCPLWALVQRVRWGWGYSRGVIFETETLRGNHFTSVDHSIVASYLHVRLYSQPKSRMPYQPVIARCFTCALVILQRVGLNVRLLGCKPQVPVDLSGCVPGGQERLCARA